jgi:hypothetical protein
MSRHPQPPTHNSTGLSQSPLALAQQKGLGKECYITFPNSQLVLEIKFLLGEGKHSGHITEHIGQAPMLFLGGRIRTKLGTYSHYEAFEYELSSYFLFCAATEKTLESTSLNAAI